MTVVIQDQRTNKFLNATDAWARHIDDARRFRTVDDAYAHARQKVPADVPVIFEIVDG